MYCEKSKENNCYNLLKQFADFPLLILVVPMCCALQFDISILAHVARSSSNYFSLHDNLSLQLCILSCMDNCLKS